MSGPTQADAIQLLNEAVEDIGRAVAGIPTDVDGSLAAIERAGRKLKAAYAILVNPPFPPELK